MTFVKKFINRDGSEAYAELPTQSEKLFANRAKHLRSDCDLSGDTQARGDALMCSSENLDCSSREKFLWLIERIRAGDGDVIAELLQHNEAWLFRWMCRNLNNNEADASYVVQETNIAVWISCERCAAENIEQLKGWIASIAHNKLKDLLRRRGRQVNISPYVENLDEVLLSADDRASQTMLPVELNDLLEKMRKAIDKLPDQKRKVLMMILEDVTQEEIATRLGVTKGRVTQVKKSAFDSLREVLGRDDNDYT